MSVLVVGSVGIDRIETPQEDRLDLLGGSASYAGLAASFHAPTSLIGIVGDDFPAHHRAVWEKRKIDLSGLQIAKGKTFRWHGRYEENMNNRHTISTDLNVFADFKPQLPAAHKNLPFVLLGNIAPDLQHLVLDQMAKPKFTIADTMNLWIDIARPRLLELLPRIDMLILNDSEAALLSGESNLLRASRWLRERGPRYVAIKKGEHGCFLSGKEGAFAAQPSHWRRFSIPQALETPSQVALRVISPARKRSPSLPSPTECSRARSLPPLLSKISA